MSNQIEDQEVDLIEDINEDQLDEMVEDVEVEDEELAEASAKKEAKKGLKAEVEVDDEEGEVEDEDEDDDDEDEDDDEKSESKHKKMAKESTELEEAAKPKTKAGMIKAMYDKMSEMKKDDLMNAYEAMFDSQKAANETKSNIDKSANDAAKAANFKEDLDALTEGEESLTEDFRDKAATIFEAALKSKVSAEVEKLEEQYEEKLAEETEQVRSELVEKVDGYLNYVVEQWMEQNEVEITNGLRTEIAENFIESLKSVFVENYVEVPESKIDMVDELAEKVEELEEQLNKSVEDNIDLAEKVADYRREDILREATIGMAETEVEKLRGLAEDLDFEDSATFEKKVATIKESYFKVKTANLQEEVQEADEEEVLSTSMAAYLSALKKSNK